MGNKKKKEREEKKIISLPPLSFSISLCPSPPFFRQHHRRKSSSLLSSPCLSPYAMKLISPSLVIPFSLLVFNSLSPQCTTVSRSTASGQVTTTRTNGDCSKEVKLVPSSVETSLQRQPRRGLLPLHRCLRPHP